MKNENKIKVFAVAIFLMLTLNYNAGIVSAAKIPEGLDCTQQPDNCETGLTCQFPASGGATAHCGKGTTQAGKLEDGIKCTSASECLGGYCEYDSVNNKVCGHSSSKFPSSATTVSSKKFSYTLLETFPGFFKAKDTMTDLPTLILAIYKFGIWTVGIAGLFMIVIGGIMYMTSAGNKSTAGSAKGVIGDAIYGIIGALTAYLFLYVINPDLVKINLNFTPVGVSEFGGPGGTGNPNPAAGSCKTDEMLNKIKANSQGKIDPCLTFALLNTESGCTQMAQSPAGACGIAQLMPNTAGVSCETLKSDINLSISKGISYLLSNRSKVRGNLSGTGNAFAQSTQDLYAVYNGGPGVLLSSTDCSGINKYGYPYVKWDCEINSGGYKETQAAAPRFLNSYLVCNDDAILQSKLK